MDLSKSYEFFKPEMLKDNRVHIIGCGSVGSTVAENLARFGVTNITLWDFDKVEEHNIVNQLFTQNDIGLQKTEALEKYVKAINPDVKIRLRNDGWDGEKLSGYVFLCVDSIETRRAIVERNRGNRDIKAMFDFRTRLTDAQAYACDWSEDNQVENFYKSMDFSHEEAQEETPMSACRVTLSVATTIRMIVACGVSNFVNFVKGESLKKLILIDAFNFSIRAM